MTETEAYKLAGEIAKPVEGQCEARRLRQLLDRIARALLRLNSKVDELTGELLSVRDERKRIRVIHNEYRAAVREIIAKEGDYLNEIAQLKAEIESLQKAKP